MARYLTPAKIGLLALIELYADAVVPTASTIPILSFIISHLLTSSTSKSESAPQGTVNGQSTEGLTISIPDFEKLLSVRPSASDLPGRSLWDLFLRKLWKINSLDALHVFFERRSHLLAKTKLDIQRDAQLGIPTPSHDMIILSRTSPLGSFVRRAALEFTRLKFQDATELWKGFIAYRQTTLPLWRRRNPAAGRWSFDGVLEEGDDDWGDGALETFASIAYRNLSTQPQDIGCFVSTHDVEKLLEFQIEQMQKLGNRVPEAIQVYFAELLNSDVLMPSLSHFVSFLDSWRAGDYTTSFDNLHRFFDYTMQNRDRTFYQYALLNLAVLQADFGCYQEAVTAMQETVSVARENKDMGCLNFSLSWLYQFGKAHPKIVNDADKTNMLGIEREGLVFLRTKAKESGMWSLWSSALLSEAKAGLSTGESVTTAFENIIRSSQLTVSMNMMNAVGAQMMLQSSLWSRLGITHLAWSYCENFLRCYSKIAPFDDVLKFTCRVAYLMTEKGNYDEALEKLDGLDVNSLRSLRANQYWLVFRGILRLKRNLHRNNLEGVDHLLKELLQCRGGDVDLNFEINRLHIEAMISRGDYRNALVKIDKLTSELKGDGEDIFFYVKLLITKALLFNKCGRPQKGFSIAVGAAAIAWRARLLSALWQAMGAIANILNSLSEFEASSLILISVLPRALECDDCALNAQLFSFHADAYMGMAGQAERQSLKRTEDLTKALESIDRSFAEYSRIEDINGQCEMMAKKAMVMSLVGDVVLANDYAAAYLDLKESAQVNYTHSENLSL